MYRTKVRCLGANMDSVTISTCPVGDLVLYMSRCAMIGSGSSGNGKVGQGLAGGGKGNLWAWQ